jgi:hypothetical protein
MENFEFSASINLNPFYYYIASEDGKSTYGENDIVSYNQFIYEKQLIFEVNNEMLKGLTSIKKYCNNNLCTIDLDNVDSFSAVQSNSEAFYFVKIFNEDDNKTFSFRIVIQNYKTNLGIYDLRLENEAKSFDDKKKNANFPIKLNEIYKNIVAIKKNVNDLTRVKDGQKENLESATKETERLKKELKDLETQQNEIQAWITKSSAEMLTLISNKRVLMDKQNKCNQDLIDLVSVKENLLKKQKLQRDEIEKAKKEYLEKKKLSAQKILYWLDAAFYFRVFKEKYALTVDSIEKAFDTKNAKLNQDKISEAFYPITFEFSDSKK